MYKQILSIIACVITLNSFAQNTKLEKSIDDLSARLVNAKEVSGVSVLLLRDVEVIYDKALGYADIETKGFFLKTLK